MKKYLKLYQQVLRLAIMRHLAYPQDFITWIIIDVLWGVINIMFFRVILLAIPDISGWTFDKLILPLGLVQILNTFIWGLMYGSLSEIPSDINRGNLDRYLVKPASSQFLLSTRFIGLNLIPSLIIGILLIWYALKINHLFSLLSIFFIVASVLSSTVIAYSVWFITITLAFWFNRLINIAEVFPRLLDIARYPVEMFHPFFRFIFTFIIPLVLLGFFPAEVVLGTISPTYIVIPFFVAALFLYLSHKFWNFALRHYSSASS